MMTKEKVLAFLKNKLKDAESDLRSRQEMTRVWRSGTNASWAEAADFHPSTAGKTLSKLQRLEEAGRQERIAVKLSKEVEMFKVAIELIAKGPNV